MPALKMGGGGVSWWSLSRGFKKGASRLRVGGRDWQVKQGTCDCQPAVFGGFFEAGWL